MYLLIAVIMPFDSQPMNLGRLFQMSPPDTSSRASSPALSLHAMFEPHPEAVASNPVAAETPCSRPATQRRTCTLCPRNHWLGNCRVFRRQTVERRLRSVLLARACERCLSPDHQARDCRSDRSCAECEGPHHTMLHITHGNRPSRHSRRPSPPAVARGRPASAPRLTSASARQALQQPSNAYLIGGTVVLLPTVEVLVTTPTQTVKLRAVVDSCSPVSKISRVAVSRLRCPTTRVGSDRMCTLMLKSVYDRASTLHAAFQEVSHLAYVTPARDLPSSLPMQLANIRLADPSFHQRAGVDLVLGGNVYAKILRPTVLQLPGLPLAQDTIFGWMLSGPCAP